MSEPKTADRNRRRLLSTGGAALALGAATTVEAKVPKTPKYSITRTRYGTKVEAVLPTVGEAYLLPFTVENFTDSNTDTALTVDNNTVTINNSGLYRISLCVDWPGQQGTDTALRTYGIRRRKSGSAVIPGNGGALIKVDDTDQHLATQDFTGSSAPQTVRLPQPGSGAVVHWTPGVIPLGGRATIDVKMPITGIVKEGDVALASLTSLNDAAIGVAAVTGLILDAKVIAADTVRVALSNPGIQAGVNVPQGNLNVVAMNVQNRVGESADGWTVLSTTMEQLFRGDVIYAVFESLCPNDYMQTSEQIFLQFDKWVKG